MSPVSSRIGIVLFHMATLAFLFKGRSALLYSLMMEQGRHRMFAGVGPCLFFFSEQARISTAIIGDGMPGNLKSPRSHDPVSIAVDQAAGSKKTKGEGASCERSPSDPSSSTSDVLFSSGLVVSRTLRGRNKLYWDLR